jgi:acetyl esterase/lipase
MRRKFTVERPAVFVFFWILLVAPCAWAEEAPPPEAHTPGPHIIPIDYDALYKMAKPPEYKPFPVYGFFLLNVATQQTPMVANPWKPVPDHVVKTADVIYKEVDGTQLGLDVYQFKGDRTPNPLILVIHGGYWKSGDKWVNGYNAIEFTEMGYTVAVMNYRL